MSLDKELIASLFDPIIAHPNVEANILYSRGGVPIIIHPPNYENDFLFKQMGFVIRSEWSLRDIYTDPDQWRIVTRQLGAYVVLLAQLSRMLLLGIILTTIDEQIEAFLLNSVDNIRETLFE